MTLRSRPVRLAAAASAASVLLAGCSIGDNDGDRAVVASFYPLAWVTGQVAGDDWEVSNLTQPGQEAHHLALDIRQTAMLEDAAVVVTHSGFQSAVDSALANTDPSHVVDVGDVVTLRPVEDGHDEEGDEDHEGHDHGDLDPHFWLDPLLMADLGDAVAAELAKADPDKADTYADNADALRTKLEELDADYTTGLAQCERNVTVVSHDAFGYLERYGLHFEPIAGLTPGAEATAADQARLLELIREHGVTTVFHERLTTSKMADSLARDAGVQTAVLDPLEGLSDETADEDYLSLMRANLDALTKANGCS
jgi:zinc transport system substrate-binding protein